MTPERLVHGENITIRVDIKKGEQLVKSIMAT